MPHFKFAIVVTKLGKEYQAVNVPPREIKSLHGSLLF